MKKFTSLKIAAFTGLIVSGLVGVGCVGKGTFDDIAGGSHPAIVEAFIDYPGPSEQWAGPPTFILHVTAKDKTAEVKIPAQWHPVSTLATGTTTTENRAPASALTGDQAREKLGALATAMEEDKSTFRGCMYPIRVRLIRADGGVLDKAGCRGQSAWSKSASETVDFFFTKI